MSDVKRLGMIRVSGELMRDHLLRSSPPDQWFRVSDGVPADAAFVRMWVDEPVGDLCLVYSHPSFPEHHPGDHVRVIPSPQLTAFTATREEIRAAAEARILARWDGDTPLAMEAR